MIAVIPTFLLNKLQETNQSILNDQAIGILFRKSIFRINQMPLRSAFFYWFYVMKGMFYCLVVWHALIQRNHHNIVILAVVILAPWKLFSSFQYFADFFLLLIMWELTRQSNSDKDRRWGWGSISSPHRLCIWTKYKLIQILTVRIFYITTHLLISF